MKEKLTRPQKIEKQLAKWAKEKPTEAELMEIVEIINKSALDVTGGSIGVFEYRAK